MTDLQEQLERYNNVLPVFGFGSAKHDICLVESFLLFKHINGLDIEPVGTKKAYQYTSFEFGLIKLLDIMNSHRRATFLDSLLKTNKTLETKKFFP